MPMADTTTNEIASNKTIICPFLLSFNLFFRTDLRRFLFAMYAFYPHGILLILLSWRPPSNGVFRKVTRIS